MPKIISTKVVDYQTKRGAESYLVQALDGRLIRYVRVAPQSGITFTADGEADALIGTVGAKRTVDAEFGDDYIAIPSMNVRVRVPPSPDSATSGATANELAALAASAAAADVSTGGTDAPVPPAIEAPGPAVPDGVSAIHVPTEAEPELLPTAPTVHDAVPAVNGLNALDAAIANLTTFREEVARLYAELKAKT